MFSMKPTVPRNCLGLFIQTLSTFLASVPIFWLMRNFSESSILPEEMASQSVRLKEEQLRREEEKVCDQNFSY